MTCGGGEGMEQSRYAERCEGPSHVWGVGTGAMAAMGATRRKHCHQGCDEEGLDAQASQEGPRGEGQHGDGVELALLEVDDEVQGDVDEERHDERDASEDAQAWVRARQVPHEEVPASDARDVARPVARQRREHHAQHGDPAIEMHWVMGNVRGPGLLGMQICGPGTGAARQLA